MAKDQKAKNSYVSNRYTDFSVLIIEFFSFSTRYLTAKGMIPESFKSIVSKFTKRATCLVRTDGPTLILIKLRF